MSILVTTPTGNIGGRIAANLADAGADFGVFARSPETLSDAIHAAAAVHQGDLTDAASLASVLQGYDTLFLLVPTHFRADDLKAWMHGVGQNAVAACGEAGVARVVFLSSAGAHHDDVGPVSALGDVEAMLRDALPDVVALRAGYFMENFLMALPTIAAQGTIYHAFPPGLRSPVVATRDIGDVATDWLTRADWTGHHTVGIHGPADLSHAEAAAQIGEGLGRAVAYVQVPVDAVLGPMREMGASDDVATRYGEMITGFIAHDFEPAEPRTEATTTPTTMATFAREVMAPTLAAQQPA